jgi:Holliday junction resolvase-like predicted endonuclease
MTRYHKGRSFEYQVKRWLEDKGYLVLRTAGSHGFADLIAIGSLGEVIFFQLSYKFEKTKYDTLQDIAYERKIHIIYLVKDEEIGFFYDVSSGDTYSKTEYEQCYGYKRG